MLFIDFEATNIINQKITHSVLCVTYNQEAYVEKSIRTLFAGNVWPDEVFILDDFSTDGTREILKRLLDEYPNNIKLIFNERNLGWCSNMAQQIGLPTGDMIHLHAGDDWYEPGMFERMNFEIESRGLNPRKEAFMLIPDFYNYFSDGSMVRHSNSAECLKDGLLSATVRQSVAHRLDGISAKLFEMYPPHVEELGLWADYHHMVIFASHCEFAYLIPEAYSVYRVGVGVSSKESAKLLNDSFIMSAKKIIYDLGGVLDKNEKKHLAYLIALHAAQAEPSLRNMLKFLVAHLTGPRSSLKSSNMKSVLRSFYMKNCVK